MMSWNNKANGVQTNWITCLFSSQHWPIQWLHYTGQWITICQSLLMKHMNKINKVRVLIKWILTRHFELYTPGHITILVLAISLEFYPKIKQELSFLGKLILLATIDFYRIWRWRTLSVRIVISNQSADFFINGCNTRRYNSSTYH